MNEIVDVEKNGNLPAVLDSYTQQGQMFLFNVAQNLVQFGRVLTEAKPLVPRGQFENWVRTSFGISERAAQGYMATWKRYGQKEQFRAVKFSSLQKMLTLPDGTEERFAEENDLENMTAREVEKAVHAVREELNKERRARRDAERRASEAEEKSGQVPDSMRAELEEKDTAIAQYKNRVDQLTRDADQLGREKDAAVQNLRDTEEMMGDIQRDYDRVQAELLNVKSSIAKGEAERPVPDAFSLEEFSSAVRSFLGSVVQLPYMNDTFSQMDAQEHRQWDSLLKAMEDWTVQARKAMNTVEIGGEVVG